MEYMNFPLDQPSSNSPYAIKMRRILEITDELELPIFIPLNGFQWWDQLPELYNWWDSDGTHTDSAFFARQKNPTEFKQRFIDGYHPDNKWNVEWQDAQTPMQLNYRNWGGGGFRLAPPPNLSSSALRAPIPYPTLLKNRLRVILDEVTPFLNKWEKENRGHLFAGLSIGTEISLNASITSRDEFLPYGYRAIHDEGCKVNDKDCVTKARQATINKFLVGTTRTVANLGIPKQRIYTHLWSEAKAGDARHANYAAAAYTLYSRPGLSFYGYATDPLSLPDWKELLVSNGLPSWGAMEYSAGNSAVSWTKGLENTFNNTSDGAKIMVIYNWQEHKDTGAPQAISSFLNQAPRPPNCNLPEVIPQTQNAALRPPILSWKLLQSGETGTEITKLTLHIKPGIRVTSEDPDVFSVTLPNDSTSFTPISLRSGTYSWYTEVEGCNGKLLRSEPRTFIMLPQFSDTTPRFVKWLLSL